MSLENVIFLLFRCDMADCRAAFTTKQCLQLHYKKLHNFNEDSMPTIVRSVDYTFQAYSGSLEIRRNNEDTVQRNNVYTRVAENESK